MLNRPGTAGVSRLSPDARALPCAARGALLCPTPVGRGGPGLQPRGRRHLSVPSRGPGLYTWKHLPEHRSLPACVPLVAAHWSPQQLTVKPSPWTPGVWGESRAGHGAGQEQPPKGHPAGQFIVKAPPHRGGHTGPCPGVRRDGSGCPSEGPSGSGPSPHGRPAPQAGASSSPRALLPLR